MVKITVVIGIKRGEWNYAGGVPTSDTIEPFSVCVFDRGLSAGLLSRDRVPEKLSSVYSLVIAHPILEQWSWGWSNWLLMVWPRVETRHILILRLTPHFLDYVTDRAAEAIAIRFGKGPVVRKICGRVVAAAR